MAEGGQLPPTDSSQMSTEEFQAKLYSWFQQKGILGDIQSYLRHLMITTLENPNVKSASQKGDCSPKVLALNWIIAEHLMRQSYQYTLSVFSGEAPMLKNLPSVAVSGNVPKGAKTQREFPKLKQKDFEDVLETFGISVDSQELKQTVEQYQNENISLLLCILKLFSANSKQHASAKEIQKTAASETVPTKYFTSHGSKTVRQNLSHTPIGIDLDYKSQKAELNAKYAASLEDRLQNFRENMEKIKNAEIELEIARFRKNELMREKTESVKYNDYLAKVMNDIEREYRSHQEKSKQPVQQHPVELPEGPKDILMDLFSKQHMLGNMMDTLKLKQDELDSKLEEAKELRNTLTEREKRFQNTVSSGLATSTKESIMHQEIEREQQQKQENTEQARWLSALQELHEIRVEIQSLSEGVQKLYRELKGMQEQLQSRNQDPVPEQQLLTKQEPVKQQLLARQEPVKQQLLAKQDSVKQQLLAKQDPLKQQLLHQTSQRDGLQETNRRVKIQEGEQITRQMEKLMHMSVKEINAECTGDGKKRNTATDVYADIRNANHYSSFQLDMENKRIEQENSKLKSVMFLQRENMEEMMNHMEMLVINKEDTLKKGGKAYNLYPITSLAHSDHFQEGVQKSSLCPNCASPTVNAIPVRCKEHMSAIGEEGLPVQENTPVEGFLSVIRKRMEALETEAESVDRSCREHLSKSLGASNVRQHVYNSYQSTSPTPKQKPRVSAIKLEKKNKDSREKLSLVYSDNNALWKSEKSLNSDAHFWKTFTGNSVDKSLIPSEDTFTTASRKTVFRELQVGDTRNKISVGVKEQEVIPNLLQNRAVLSTEVSSDNWQRAVETSVHTDSCKSMISASSDRDSHNRQYPDHISHVNNSLSVKEQEIISSHGQNIPLFPAETNQNNLHAEDMKSTSLGTRGGTSTCGAAGAVQTYHQRDDMQYNSRSDRPASPVAETTRSRALSQQISSECDPKEKTIDSELEMDRALPVAASTYISSQPLEREMDHDVREDRAITADRESQNGPDFQMDEWLRRQRGEGQKDSSTDDELSENQISGGEVE